MYQSNPLRNRAIYDLWEKSLTIDQISALTGIPRSTVGYYVRKFNRLATEGKPIIFPKKRGIPAEAPKPSFFSEVNQILKEKILINIRVKILKLITQQSYEELYYFLQDLKLIAELDSFLSTKTLEKLLPFRDEKPKS